MDKYIALEPNVLMHGRIRERAFKSGYSEAIQPSKSTSGHFIILSQGAEDIAGIKAAIHQHGISHVDTIISVLTFCSIPSPHTALPSLVKSLLKPEGQFLFYEHVLNPLKDVQIWQRRWSPIWSMAFDGCRLDVPTDTIVKSVRHDDGTDFWKAGNDWTKKDELESHLFLHKAGRYIRS